MEKLKDLFHNFSDILLAITVAAIMYFVLSTSLGSWFNNPSNTVVANNSDTLIEENADNNEADIHVSKNNKQDYTDDSNLIDETVDNNKADEIIEEETESDTIPDSDVSPLEPNDLQVGTKKIVIPNGTPSSGIAKILKDNNLIEDSNIFTQTSEELNLSVRLKSGTFEIPYNSSVEDMVKIIAGQKK